LSIKRKAATIFAAACLGAGPVHAEAAPRPAPVASVATPDAALLDDLADGSLDTHTLDDAALIASGVSTPEELQRYRARLDTIVDEAVRRTGTRGGPEHRARRLLAALHRGPLRLYQASSDRFTDLIDGGTYNCVSATLLYLIAAGRAGLPVAAAETPLHVFAVLSAPSGDVDIETTSPRGYAAHHDLPGFRRFVLDNKYATEEELAQRGLEAVYDEFRRLTRPVPAPKVIAFLYYNAGIRALRAGDSVEAARQLVSAARIYPGLAYRSENLRTTLAWASREQYDAGRFEEAFTLAELAMRFFPDRTTVRDRFTAVGARVVTETAERGDLDAAAGLESRLLSRLDDTDCARKLESHTAPVMARAALLAHRYDMATRHADRYRIVSDDAIEAERFARWVEARVEEARDDDDGTLAAIDYVAEERAAARECEGVADSRVADCRAVVGAVATLARQGRYDQALAVGRVQLASIEGAAPVALDTLLRTVAAHQVTTLALARRYEAAASAAAAALAAWPGDPVLMAARQRVVSARAGDPFQLRAWPAGLTATGMPAAAGIPVAGTAPAPVSDETSPVD